MRFCEKKILKGMHGALETVIDFFGTTILR